MASLTRWVLAHRKLVVVFWIVITVVGIAIAGAASKAMDQKFSVPGREGWDTNVAIAEQYMGTGGNTAPIVPVVTLPEGSNRGDPGRQAAARRDGDDAGEGPPRSPHRRLRLHRLRRVPLRGRSHRLRIAYPTPDPDQPFGDNPQAAKDAAAAREGRADRRRAGAPDRLRRAQQPGRRRRGPGRPDRGARRRLRRAPRARLRLRARSSRSCR